MSDNELDGRNLLVNVDGLETDRETGETKSFGVSMSPVNHLKGWSPEALARLLEISVLEINRLYMDLGMELFEARMLGLQIAKLRQEKGISVEDMGKRTYVSARTIEQLEAGHYPKIFHPVWEEFIKRVAQVLEIEKEDLLGFNQKPGEEN